MGRPDPKVWAAMLSHLRQHHSSMCRHWFEDIEPQDLSGVTLRLLVRNEVQLKYLQRACTQSFGEAAQAITGRLVGVQFIGEDDIGDDGRVLTPIVRQESALPSNGLGTTRSDLGPLATDDDMLISPDYSFDTFVIGPGNRLAHAAAVAVAAKPGKAYNPFFIHGGVGLGKTHLLQAICQATMRLHQGIRIHYVSCNAFMTQFIDAVQAGVMNDFRSRYRHVDVLVVDDIHDLSKRDRTQEEFFHTFNALFQAGKQIVLSSDAAPAEIPSIEERLVSRFNCGLVAEMEKPCFETRVEIIKRKSAMRNLVVPDEVANYVAARIDSNIRELEGAINKIQSLADLANTPIDLELAKQAVGDRMSVAGSAPTIQMILETISAYYDVRLTELLSKRRSKSIAHPRQVGMWLARKYTRYSLEEIGGYYGGRDHTTVMHAIKQIELKRHADAAIDREVTRLEDLLTDGEGGASVSTVEAPAAMPASPAIACAAG